MLFLKLTGGPFKDNFFKFAEFWVFIVHRIFKMRVRVFVEQVKFVLLPEMDQMKPKVWAGSMTHQ